MKNNLTFTGLFESSREYTEGILREFIKNELGIEKYIEFGNVHRFGRRETPDRKPRPIVARFIYNRQPRREGDRHLHPRRVNRGVRENKTFLKVTNRAVLTM